MTTALRTLPMMGSRTADSSATIAIAVIGAVALGAAAYYGYCRVEATSHRNAFLSSVGNLQQAILRVAETPGIDDIRQAVVAMAKAAKCEVNPHDVRVVIDRLRRGDQRLSGVTRQAMGMASSLPRHRIPRWLIGFVAPLTARYSFVTINFSAEGYTWIDELSDDPDTAEAISGVVGYDDGDDEHSGDAEANEHE